MNKKNKISQKSKALFSRVFIVSTAVLLIVISIIIVNSAYNKNPKSEINKQESLSSVFGKFNIFSYFINLFKQKSTEVYNKASDRTIGYHEICAGYGYGYDKCLPCLECVDIPNTDIPLEYGAKRCEDKQDRTTDQGVCDATHITSPCTNPPCLCDEGDCVECIDDTDCHSKPLLRVCIGDPGNPYRQDVYTREYVKWCSDRKCNYALDDPIIADDCLPKTCTPSLCKCIIPQLSLNPPYVACDLNCAIEKCMENSGQNGASCVREEFDEEDRTPCKYGNCLSNTILDPQNTYCGCGWSTICNYLDGSPFRSLDCGECTKCKGVLGADAGECVVDETKIGSICIAKKPNGDYGTCGEQTGICDSNGNCVRSPCDATFCQKCVGNEAVPDPLKNLLDCTTPTISDGYCSNGVCKKKDCKYVFGENFESCSGDETNENDPSTCCKQGKCCKPPSGFEFSPSDAYRSPICCKDNEICTVHITSGTYHHPLAGDYNINVAQPICKITTCPEDKPIFCDADISICCPTGYQCLKETPLISGPVTLTLPLPSTAQCGKPTCDQSAGEFECGIFNPKLCCDKYQKCIAVGVFYPLKMCVANCQSTKPGYKCCQGTGSFDQISRWCKLGTEECFVQAGYPQCYPLSQEVTNPTQQSSTSAYMIRKKGLFNLNGITYIIKPHIEFKNDITISFEPYGSTYQTYKYQSHVSVLESCNYSLISSSSKKISSSGGKVFLGTKIKLDIPANALTSSTVITIEEYNLTNCYSGLNDPIDEIRGVLLAFEGINFDN